MNQINLKTLDLNLLRLLVAISDTGSVSLAAEQIGISQPAASNSLGRLRDAIGDPLFVRSRKRMIPTPYGETVLPGVRAYLDGIYETFSFKSSFDPKNSQRTFRLSLSGLGELVFLPQLAETVLGSAPNVRLLNEPVPVNRLVDALEDGKVDCAIGLIDLKARGLLSHALFNESYVAVSGKGLENPPSSIRDLRKHRMVVSAPTASYASDLTKLLSENQLSDNVALQLANFGALPKLLDRLPLVAIVPLQYVEQLKGAANVRVLPIELKQTLSTARLVWSERTNADDACLWLRNCIIGEFYNLAPV